MIDLCFIIPTYNRTDQLIKTINQINNVFNNQGINYTIQIIDNSEDKNTELYFENNNYFNLNYYKRINSINGNLSIHKAFLETKIKSQLYWWFGDDDYVLPDAVTVIKYLLINDKIQYLHATDKTYCLTNTNIIDKGSELLSHFGILELTSFMTSQVFTRKIFDKVNIFLNNEINKLDWNFNFNQSFMLSEIIWSELCMISEKGLVIAQNHVHHNNHHHNTIEIFYDSIKGWFPIIHNINRFLLNLNLSTPINPRLLLYRSKPVWEIYVKWMLSYLSYSTNKFIIYDLESIKKILILCGQTKGFYYDLIDTIIIIEKLRINSTDEFNNTVIIPFYKSVYSNLT